MGDNTEMGTLAVTEELHAKQQEAARKEAERAARKAPHDAAARAKPGNQRPKRVRPPGAVVLQVDPQSAAERAGLKPGDLVTNSMGHRYATPPTCSSGWRCCGSAKSPNSPCRARAAR